MKVTCTHIQQASRDLREFWNKTAGALNFWFLLHKHIPGVQNCDVCLTFLWGFLDLQRVRFDWSCSCQGSTKDLSLQNNLFWNELSLRFNLKRCSCLINGADAVKRRPPHIASRWDTACGLSLAFPHRVNPPPPTPSYPLPLWINNSWFLLLSLIPVSFKYC